MVKVTCKRCHYEWEYKGRRTMYGSCPNCKTTVRLQMFIANEKTELENTKYELEQLGEKYDDLVNFFHSRNPELLAEWRDSLIAKAKKEAEEILKGDTEGGKKPLTISQKNGK